MKLEFIQDYKGESILIYKTNNKRIFKYGNTEFDSIKDAKALIDTIVVGLKECHLDLMCGGNPE